MEEKGDMETKIKQRVSAAWRNCKTCSGVLCDRRMPVKLKWKTYKENSQASIAVRIRDVGDNKRTTRSNDKDE